MKGNTNLKIQILKSVNLTQLNPQYTLVRHITKVRDLNTRGFILQREIFQNSIRVFITIVI